MHGVWRLLERALGGLRKAQQNGSDSKGSIPFVKGADVFLWRRCFVPMVRCGFCFDRPLGYTISGLEIPKTAAGKALAFETGGA